MSVSSLCVQRFARRALDADRGQRPSSGAKVPPPAIAVSRARDPKGNYLTAEARAQAQLIDELAFNPWNVTDAFRPLGNLNRARKTAYDASAAQRHDYRWLTRSPLRNILFGAIARGVFRVVDRFVAWHRLPAKLGLLNLGRVPATYCDTRTWSTPTFPMHRRGARAVPQPIPEAARRFRMDDGTYNRSLGTADGLGGCRVRPGISSRAIDRTCSTRLILS